MDKIAQILELAKTYQFLCQAKKLKKIRKTYGPYLLSPNSKRKIVIVHYMDGSKRTISYPKHLLEQKLKKQLDPDLHTIDHKNFNIDDNRLSNLRVVPRDQHSADDTRRVKLVKLKCSLCKKEFERSPRIVRDKSRKGVRGIFCSRNCAGRYARALQLGKIKKFKKVPYISSEYYRRKNVADLINRLAIKYG